jgi:hypothetical protein
MDRENGIRTASSIETTISLLWFGRMDYESGLEVASFTEKEISRL